MVVGHEMAHALREHARSRIAKSEGTGTLLSLAARAGFNPDASVSLWEKMDRAGSGNGPGFLSTHPSGPDRIQRLQANVPRVRGLYLQALARR